MHRNHLFALLGRNHQLFGVDRLLEHLFGNTGGGIGVDRHIHGAGEFGGEAVYALNLLQHHAEVDHIHPVVESLDAEFHHVEHRHVLARHGVFTQRRSENRGLNLQRVGLGGVEQHLDAVTADEGLHAVNTRHGLHLGREGLRRAEALDRLQSLHLEGLQILDLLVIAPFLVDRGQLHRGTHPHGDEEEHDGQQSRHPAQRTAAVDLQGVLRTGADTVAAKRAIDVLHLHVVVDRQLIGALFLAETAVVAGADVTLDVHQREDAAAHLDDLDDICGQTCAADGPDPCVRNAQHAENPAAEGRDDEQQREFENVAGRPQRTDILAPEHLHHEAAQQQQRKARERHPEHDLALESRSHRIERIEFLAEQLARREREIEDREEQHVLHHAQQFVHDAARRNLDLQMQFLSGAAHPFADGAQRTEVAAEKFAEQDHSHGEHEAHHDLEHRHRAGQRVVHQIGSESLQTAEGTVSLDIDGFFAEVGPEHRACNGGQYAPLQDVLQVIGFAFHVSLSIVFVCAERVIPCP